MSGIIDIRVVTEAPFKLAIAAGVIFFALAHWHMPASLSSLFARLPLFSSLNVFTQIEVIKALLVALVTFFVLRWKKSWILNAVSADAPPQPSSSK